MSIYPKHDEDFYGWAFHTVQLLKDKKMNEIDFEGIIEELEDMGRSEKNQLVNRLSVLIAHLMKWEYQPPLRQENARGWEATIEHQRTRIKRLIKQNPSLKPKIPEAVQEGFLDSKIILKKETDIDLKILPSSCPYTFDQLVDDAFYPN